LNTVNRGSFKELVKFDFLNFDIHIRMLKSIIFANRDNYQAVDRGSFF